MPISQVKFEVAADDADRQQVHVQRLCQAQQVPQLGVFDRRLLQLGDALLGRRQAAPQLVVLAAQPVDLANGAEDAGDPRPDAPIVCRMGSSALALMLCSVWAGSVWLASRSSSEMMVKAANHRPLRLRRCGLLIIGADRWRRAA